MTVAVALLGVATALVVLALPTQSPVWLSAASVVSLACGWAAARIVYSELVQSRREAAADRAAQAQAYRSLFAERAAEHAEFTTAMTDRLTRRDRALAELESVLGRTQRRAIEAEARVRREARRTVEAQVRVQELSERVEELEIAQAERDDELASWDGEVPTDARTLAVPDLDAVADLLAWEERVTSATSGSQQPRRRQA